MDGLVSLMYAHGTLLIKQTNSVPHREHTTCLSLNSWRQSSGGPIC